MDETTNPTRPPALWNPNVAANWSLLFSPAFGAFLHARNAAAMGRIDEAKANKFWVWISLGYFGFVGVSVFMPSIPDVAFQIVPIFILLRWYFSLGRKQIRHVKDTYQNEYPHKSWTKPLLIAVCLIIGYGLFISLLIVVQQAILEPR